MDKLTYTLGMAGFFGLFSPRFGFTFLFVMAALAVLFP